MIRVSDHALKYIRISVAVLSVSGTCCGGIVVGDVPIAGNPQVSIGRPTSDNSRVIIVSRKQFVVSWDYQRRIPEWVAWTLTRRHLGDITRNNSFRLDWDLDEALIGRDQESVSPADYTGSCLDRGHQVPSADRTSNDEDNESTFLMSNIMPQSAYLNRTTWVSLERFLRRQVIENNQQVQIYSGVIRSAKGSAIGPNKDIEVPSSNFKVAVFVPRNRERLAKDTRYFVVNFPNVTSKGTDPVKDHKQACWDSEHTARLDESNRRPLWRKFLSKLATVERASGIRFNFLHRYHEMSPKEVDDTITDENFRFLFKQAVEDGW